MTTRKIDARAKAVRASMEWAASKSDAPAALAAIREALRICDEDPAYRLLELVPGADARFEPKSFSKPFIARYAGRCVSCDAPVAVGAEVVYRTSDRAVAHAVCGGRK